jgi:hypothetical protein
MMRRFYVHNTKRIGSASNAVRQIARVVKMSSKSKNVRFVHAPKMKNALN